ncbi:hypothetical protein G7Y89_g14532 [Cudoniella acicularis]|uniref:Uncharacterized protein n=1 Tax=Cudoniella acicularis TaxID=354080 RepID=A0A8H4VV73_9HELO|nr:hypothetical protein G7Y89_g14532 [Cudoniella acicularis]
MSSSKPSKKVHYSSTTKGGKSSSSHGHSHKGSRDSGVGSSSASDRASLGTSPNESPFNSQEIQFQRHNPTALNEALNAANEKIRELEEKNEMLNALLTESNRENRLLKRERKELLEKVDDLEQDVDDERAINERLRRENIGSPRTSAATTTTANSSATRRGSVVEQRRFSRSNAPTLPPLVPQAPQSSAPNPFTPLSERPAVTYAPASSQVAYAPTTISYAPSPVFTTVAQGPRQSSKKKQVQQVQQQQKQQQQQERMYPNDGNYHPYPV